MKNKIEDYYNDLEMRYYNRPILGTVPQLEGCIYLGGGEVRKIDSGERVECNDSPYKNFFPSSSDKGRPGTLLEFLRRRRRGDWKPLFYLLERYLILGIDPNKIFIKSSSSTKTDYVLQGDSETFGCYEHSETVVVDDVKLPISAGWDGHRILYNIISETEIRFCFAN